ncbi:hypothetical protein GZH47_07060 [Paenibacillus rhizovicinus]|uniref:Uncharacterized protein n=1 Tax=Paenibacillus rhizovicinus TaxID=2704463 RepID=A0A6C0NXI2_9BACL|nr:hypothetical protein [Paenibacillus rhizovicinus]QHW30636.1 hypothetical protein GZH47_07060 [Paenibacillus rhizovicinus]
MKELWPACGGAEFLLVKELWPPCGGERPFIPTKSKSWNKAKLIQAWIARRNRCGVL